MAPVFSIIIPVYNVAPYLHECLDSVLAQTFPDWEAVCVDDGSVDGSGMILDKYAVEDKRFRVIHQKNSGVSVARNVALNSIKGEWFIFLDSDDMLRNDALEIFAPYAKRNECDGILIQPYLPFWDGKGTPQRKIKTCVLKKEAVKEDLVFGKYAANGVPFSRVYRTCMFRHLRFPVGVKVAEDIRFWFDALCVPARWTILNAEYYLYRQRVDSVCGQKNPNDCEAILSSVLYVFGIIEKWMCFGKNGRRRYLERWLALSSEYLNIYITRYRDVNIESRKAIFAKLKEIKRQIGALPYARRMKWKLWFIEHRVGYLMPALDFAFMVRSVMRRFAKLVAYIRNRGLRFGLGKIKRLILHQGEYAGNDN